MKFLRSTLFATATVLVAAACGDKVTVAGPTTTAPKVNSVSVAPATATLNVGDKITMTAAVNADAGVATTVTWSSSGAAATVDAGGIVTAVSASPGIAICATSTVNTSVKGCGSVVIAAVAPPIPATVSIASITWGGELNSPVDPTDVGGQIDIKLNVNPGNQTITKVVLYVGADSADAQAFTAAQSAALRSAADLSVAAQTTFPQVLFSINTAKYDTTTGAAKWTNKGYGVSARVYTKQAGTASAATASAATNLVFNNSNRWFVRATLANATKATSPAGYAFRTGAITATAVPVIYNGVTMSTTAAASLTFRAGCSPTGSVTNSLPTAAPYTATFALTGYEFRCGGGDAVGFSLTAVDSNGDQLFSGDWADNYSKYAYRMDNLGPDYPTFSRNPNGRSNDWINDDVVFNAIHGTGAKVNNWIAGEVDDYGVGGGTSAGNTYSVQWAVSASGTVDEALTGTAATSAALIPNSATSTRYCGLAVARDAFGNASEMPAAGQSCDPTDEVSVDNVELFGVDRIKPGITPLTATAGNTKSLRMFTVAPTQVQFTLSDTSLNAASANITVTGSAIRYSGTTAADTLAISQTIAPPTTTITTAWGAGGSGYWTVTATAADQAGNSTSITPYVFLYDAAAATATGGMQTNASPTAGSATETFYATFTDNVDLDSAYVTHTLMDGAATPLAWPFIINRSKVQPSPFLVAAPIKSSVVTGAWPGYPRGFGTIASGAAVSTAMLGASSANTAVNFWSTDQTNGTTGTLDAGSTAHTVGPVPYTAVNLPAAAAWANTHTEATVTLAFKRGVASTLYQTATSTHLNVSDTITVTMTEAGVAVPPTANAFTRAELWVRTSSTAATDAATAATKGFQLLSSLTPTVTYDGQAQIITTTYTYIFTPGKAYAASGAANSWYAFLGYDSKSNVIAVPSATALMITP